MYHLDEANDGDATTPTRGSIGNIILQSLAVVGGKEGASSRKQQHSPFRKKTNGFSPPPPPRPATASLIERRSRPASGKLSFSSVLAGQMRGESKVYSVEEEDSRKVRQIVASAQAKRSNRPATTTTTISGSSSLTPASPSPGQRPLSASQGGIVSMLSPTIVLSTATFPQDDATVDMFNFGSPLPSTVKKTSVTPIRKGQRIREWVASFEQESASFHSIATQCATRMKEVQASVRGDPTLPDAFRTAVCCEIFDHMIQVYGTYSELMNEVKCELERAIFVEGATGDERCTEDIYSRTPYFVLHGRQEDERKLLDKRRKETSEALNDAIRNSEHAKAKADKYKIKWSTAQVDVIILTQEVNRLSELVEAEKKKLREETTRAKMQEAAQEMKNRAMAVQLAGLQKLAEAMVSPQEHSAVMNRNERLLASIAGHRDAALRALKQWGRSMITGNLYSDNSRGEANFIGTNRMGGGGGGGGGGGVSDESSPHPSTPGSVGTIVPSHYRFPNVASGSVISSSISSKEDDGKSINLLIRGSGETIEKLAKIIPIDDILIRWANFHLDAAGYPPVMDLSSDWIDGAALCALLRQIAKRLPWPFPHRQTATPPPPPSQSMPSGVAIAAAAMVAVGVRRKSKGGMMSAISRRNSGLDPPAESPSPSASRDTIGSDSSPSVGFPEPLGGRHRPPVLDESVSFSETLASNNNINNNNEAEGNIKATSEATLLLITPTEQLSFSSSDPYTRMLAAEEVVTKIIGVRLGFAEELRSGSDRIGRLTLSLLMYHAPCLHDSETTRLRLDLEACVEQIEASIARIYASAPAGASSAQAAAVTGNNKQQQQKGSGASSAAAVVAAAEEAVAAGITDPDQIQIAATGPGSLSAAEQQANDEIAKQTIEFERSLESLTADCMRATSLLRSMEASERAGLTAWNILAQRLIWYSTILMQERSSNSGGGSGPTEAGRGRERSSSSASSAASALAAARKRLPSAGNAASSRRISLARTPSAILRTMASGGSGMNSPSNASMVSDRSWPEDEQI